MSGRHTGGTNGRLRIAALPRTLKLVFKLAPRQLKDEIALAQAEIKRKGIQLGTAAAFLAVALVFIAFLLTGLIVAAIMGLATVMPAWLAALLVCGGFLVIALIAALVGYRKFKKAMPLVPAETLRSFKHDLGIAKEGSAFDPAVLDPDSAQYKAVKAAKAQAAAAAKAAKEAKAAAGPGTGPQPQAEADLRRRLGQRRAHLTAARDDLTAELDIRPQAQALLTAAQSRLQDGKEQLGGKVAGLRSSVRTSAQGLAQTAAAAGSAGVTEKLVQRWKPLAVLTASAAALVYLLRRLLKG